MKKLLFAAALFSGVVAANAQVLVDQQPTDYGNGREGDASDDFSDFPTFTTYGFDDFVVSGAPVVVGTVVAYGIELGVPGGVANMRIVQTPNHTSPGTVYGQLLGGGSEAAANWTFTGLSITLNPGTYWLEVWANRNFGTSGQWNWANSSANGTTGVRGSESYLHNPGNGFGFGSDPFPASQAGFHGPRDNAFTITVPEPGTMLAIGTGLAALLARRRRK